MQISLSPSALVPCYGQEITKQILDYIAAFTPFEDGFLKIVPTISESNGARLLLVRCPLALPYIDVHNGSSPVTLGVLFTPQFPTRAPVCAILLEPGAPVQLPQNFPWLNPNNGSLKLPLVPGLDVGTGVPSLMQLLLAVTAALVDHPLPASAPRPMSASVSTAGPASPTAGTSPQVPPPPTTLPPSSTLPNDSNLLLDTHFAAFVAQKEQGARRLAELRESRATLERLASALGDKERILQAASTKFNDFHARSSAILAEGPLADPLTCLEAPDVARTQAVELLAEVMALEDLLDLYEKRLKKGTIAVNAYLRLVGDASRRQFLAKYKIKKLHGIVTAKQNFASLSSRFPQFDGNTIGMVLSEHRYSFGEAARHLGEMAH